MAAATDAGVRATVPHRVSPRDPRPAPRRTLVVTRDRDLFRLVARAAGSEATDVCFDAPSATRALTECRYDLTVVDDEAVDRAERAWMLDEIHRRRPEALVIYVAGDHGEEIERTARVHGAAAYLAKPVEVDRLMPLVRRALTVVGGGGGEFPG